MSRSPGNILVLEDHEPTSKRLALCVKSNGLIPRVYLSSRTCHERLENWGEEPHPLLAIIDLDMRLAPENQRTPTSFDVLRLLAKSFPSVIVLVYSGELDSDHNRAAVWKAHPRALLQDKGNIDELQERIDALLSKEVGSFRLYHGLVMHVPTSEYFPHEVGARIMLAHPGVIRIPGQAEARAVQRFRKWVISRDPQVTVINQSKHAYCLATIDKES